MLNKHMDTDKWIVCRNDRFYKFVGVERYTEEIYCFYKGPKYGIIKISKDYFSEHLDEVTTFGSFADAEKIRKSLYSYQFIETEYNDDYFVDLHPRCRYA